MGLEPGSQHLDLAALSQPTLQLMGIVWLRILRYYHGPTPVNPSQYSSSSEVVGAVERLELQLSGQQTSLTKVGEAKIVSI